MAGDIYKKTKWINMDGGLPKVTAAFITLLAAANVYFTYKGAILFVKEMTVAALFAVAIQSAIALSLIALPYVKGIRSFVLYAVYTTALSLSVIAAYTFIFNSSTQESRAYSYDITFTKAVSSYMGDLHKAERDHLSKAGIEVAQKERALVEENELGGKSGKGPGMGPVYAAKLELYADASQAYEVMKEQYALFDAQRLAIKGMLGTEYSRSQILTEIYELKSLAVSEEAAEVSEDDLEKALSTKTPSQQAMESLWNPSGFSDQVFTSLMWAAMFDVIALLMAVIRTAMVRKSRGFGQWLVSLCVSFISFFFELTSVFSRAKNRHDGNMADALEAHKKIELIDFVGKIFGACKATMGSEDNRDQLMQPMYALSAAVRPLALDGKGDGVGIPFEIVEEDHRLPPLVAVMMQDSVLKVDEDIKTFVVTPNEGSDKDRALWQLVITNPDKIMQYFNQLQPDDMLAAA